MKLIKLSWIPCSGYIAFLSVFFVLRVRLKSKPRFFCYVRLRACGGLLPGSFTSERKALPSCFLGSETLYLAAAMVSSPGTPLGGERGRRRSLSPPAAGAASGVTGPMVMDAPSTAGTRVLCPVPSYPCSDTTRHRGVGKHRNHEGPH